MLMNSGYMTVMTVIESTLAGQLGCDRAQPRHSQTPHRLPVARSGCPVGRLTVARSTGTISHDCPVMVEIGLSPTFDR